MFKKCYYLFFIYKFLFYAIIVNENNVVKEGFAVTVVENKLQTLISAYNTLVKGIDIEASISNDRAYGGIIRAGKGELVESMVAHLIQIAWCDVLGQRASRLEINKKKMPIKVKDNYIDRIKEPAVREYVRANKNSLIYKFGTDVQVFIDNKLVIPIECKAYSENAMLKRILFDAVLMKEVAGTDVYYLVQLESQLGGDYSALNDITYGSPATHALLSHVDVELKIITLLQGERKVDKPIHKKEYFKELRMSELQKALDVFTEALRPYVK